MKCDKISCNQRPVIRFEYKDHNDSYCLEHLVNRLDYIKDNKHFHILTNIKKIIPIFNF